MTPEDVGGGEKVAQAAMIPTHSKPVDVAEVPDGMIRESLSNLKKITELGKEGVGLGVVRLNNGFLLGSKEVVFDFMEKMKQRANAVPEEAVAAARATASLGNTMSKLSTQFRAANEAGPKKPKSKKNSFALGQAVQVNVQVNNDSKSTEPKP